MGSSSNGEPVMVEGQFQSSDPSARVASSHSAALYSPSLNRRALPHEKALLTRAGRWTGRVCGEFRSRVTDRFDNLIWRTHTFEVSGRTRMREIKEEHPFRILAAISVAAFGLGMIVRAWRSRQS